MTRETLATLNTDTLIGYTDKRGTAWHYRADLQSAEPNHYPGPIPVEDVRRRLFSWTPVEAQSYALTPDGFMFDPTRKQIVRPDTQTVLGVFKQGYRVHDYSEWLTRHVETIVDADLAIASAGLLKKGAVAWVAVEMEDTLSVADLDFRPFLTAASSLDGSIATTYQTGCQLAVCDNTLAGALREDTLRIKIKHSVHSLQRVGEIRAALDIVHAVADEFAAEVAELASTKVSDQRFDRWVSAYSGLGKLTADSKPSKRSLTMAGHKAETLSALWFGRSGDLDADHAYLMDAVNPWRGTALGVLQAANTYEHHFAIVRGASRAERNAERMVMGKVSDLDAHALQVLQSI